MVAALIKFAQGANVGVAGQALYGVVGQPVVVSNADNTGVDHAVFTVIDAPPSSALTPGIVQSGTTLTWTWTPDTTDMVEVQLQVFDVTGQLTATARSCFGVQRASGRIIPAFTAVAQALNFAGALRGWASIMEFWLDYLDSLTSGGSPNAGIDILVPNVTNASKSSTQTITPTQIVKECKLRVDTPFTAGATVAVGNTTNPSLLCPATGTNAGGTDAVDIVNCPAGFIFDLSPSTFTAWGGSVPSAVLVTLSAGAVGSLSVLVTYTTPAG